MSKQMQRAQVLHELLAITQRACPFGDRIKSSIDR